MVEAPPAPAPAPLPVQDILLGWDIAPNDPLLAYFQHSSGAVEVERLHLDSPALRCLKDEGVAVIVPLLSQGELIGIINLGQRRSDQEYSSDDRRFLDDLAAGWEIAAHWQLRIVAAGAEETAATIRSWLDIYAGKIARRSHANRQQEPVLVKCY